MRSIFKAVFAICLCLAALGDAEHFPVKHSSVNKSLRIFPQNDTKDHLVKVPELASDPPTSPSTDPSDEPMSDPPSPEPDTNEAVWQKALCNGQKLYQAMIRDSDQIANFIAPSTFDGDMKAELEAWGYSDLTGESYYDAHCDFESGADRHSAFDAMGIDKRASAAGGPNKCFHVQHYNSAKVKRQPPDYKMPQLSEQRYDEPDGKEYRVSHPSRHRTMVLLCKP
jgi:hypothetical protein